MAAPKKMGMAAAMKKGQAPAAGGKMPPKMAMKMMRDKKK